MTIALRAAGSSLFSTNATTLVHTKPSSPSAIVAGNCVFAVSAITSNGAAGSHPLLSAPSGMPELIAGQFVSQYNQIRVYQRIAGGSEPASYDAGSSGTAIYASHGCVIAFSSDAAALEVEASDVSVVTSAETDHIAPSLTSLGSGRMLINIWFHGDGNQTPGQVYTLDGALTATLAQAEGGSGAYNRTAIGHQIVGAGATGTRMSSIVSARPYVAISILLREASAGASRPPSSTLTALAAVNRAAHF